MPELPEVETIRRDIDQLFVGRRIEAVAATGQRSVRRHPDPAEFEERTRGRRLVSTRRRGKYILLDLDDSDVVVAHLGMSGQLLAVAGDAPTIKHTHVVLRFSGPLNLRFVDPRTFGQMFVSAGSATDERLPELAHLGFDPLDERVDPKGLARLLAPRRVRLKPLLMDQRFVAGIGNMYADEILFAARLRSDRIASELSTAEVRRLRAAMADTLGAAIQHRGSSLADEQYRDLFGAVGQYQHLHQVYDREGLPCSRCPGTIVRVKYGGRSSFFCPRCQR